MKKAIAMLVAAFIVAFALMFSVALFFLLLKLIVAIVGGTLFWGTVGVVTVLLFIGGWRHV